MKFNQKQLLIYPKQTIDTKTHRWNDVIGYCPFCEIETVISAYAVLGNALNQECCRTCGKWWNVHITSRLVGEDKN